MVVCHVWNFCCCCWMDPALIGQSSWSSSWWWKPPSSSLPSLPKHFIFFHYYFYIEHNDNEYDLWWWNNWIWLLGLYTNQPTNQLASQPIDQDTMVSNRPRKKKKFFEFIPSKNKIFFGKKPNEFHTIWIESNWFIHSIDWSILFSVFWL